MPFLDLLEKYCELAGYMKEEVAIEKFIEERDLENIENSKRIEANEAIVQALNSVSSQDSVNLLKEQHRIFAEKENRLS